MELTLPTTDGWSAMHLSEATWGRLTVIAKREYRLAGGVGVPASNPVGVVVVDTPGGESLAREADTALLKLHADWHVLGYGTVEEDQVTAADLNVNGVTQVSYTHPAVNPNRDPVNLFGYEPRSRRSDFKDGFDFAAQAPDLFRATRREMGYFVGPSSLPLPQTMDVIATVQTASGSATVADFTLVRSDVEADFYVWEGWQNDPAYWCKRAPLALVADTLTVDGDDISIVWRGSVALADYPLADIRRIDIREVA